MSEHSAVEDSIKYCIEKNGFPEKCVRLPFKVIHENCKKYDCALKEVLENLARDKIIGTIQGNFIEFRPSGKPPKTSKNYSKTNVSSQTNPLNTEILKEMAQSYMSKMDPDQIKDLEKTVADMSEEDKKNILKNFSEQFFKDKL